MFNVFLEKDTVWLVSFMSPQSKMYERMSDSATALANHNLLLLL